MANDDKTEANYAYELMIQRQIIMEMMDEVESGRFQGDYDTGARLLPVVIEKMRVAHGLEMKMLHAKLYAFRLTQEGVKT